MREMHLERRDAGGSWWGVYLKRHGRKIVAASHSPASHSPADVDASPAPPPFEVTGLACRVCYGFTAEEMPEVLWLLVDRRRRRAMRINSGMSQQQVAEAMGTTQSAVSEFERLEMFPNVTTLLRYARAVGGRLQLAVTVGEPNQSDDPA